MAEWQLWHKFQHPGSLLFTRMVETKSCSQEWGEREKTLMSGIHAKSLGTFLVLLLQEILASAVFLKVCFYG